MTIKIRIIIAVILLVAFILIVRSIVKRKLDVKYAMPWLFMLCALAVFDAVPTFLFLLTDIMGITSPVNMLFFLGFCFSLIIIFYLTSTIYSVSNRLRRVAQELALLRNEMSNNMKNSDEE